MHPDGAWSGREIDVEDDDYGECALTVFAALVWFLMAAALVVELLIALVLTLA